MVVRREFKKTQRSAARPVRKPVQKIAPRISIMPLKKLLTSLNTTRTALESRIKQSSGKAKAELATAYRYWRRRELIVTRNLKAGVKGAADSAGMLVSVGSFLATAQTKTENLLNLLSDVNENILGRPENMTFLAGKIREARILIPAIQKSIHAYLRRPSKKSFNAVAIRISSYNEKAGKALSYYGAAMEYQDRQKALIQYTRALRAEIKRNIGLAKTLGRSKMDQRENKKIQKQLRILEASVKLRGKVKDREQSLKKYKLQDLVREKRGLLHINPIYLEDVESAEKALKRSATSIPILSWELHLVKAVHDYFAKPKQRVEVKKRVKTLVSVGRAVIGHQIIALPKFVTDPLGKDNKRHKFSRDQRFRMEHSKKQLLEWFKDLEAVLFKGKFGDAKVVAYNMSKDSFNADARIGRIYREKMQQHFDRRGWWEKYSRSMFDVAVVGLGLLGSVVSGGFASPFIAAAEAVYFAGTATVDMVGQYMLTRRMPGIFEILGAAAMVITPAARAARGFVALKGAGALRAELSLAVRLRAIPEVIERRMMAELALKETRALRFITISSDISAKYLLGASAVGIIRDPSLENLLHNAVFFAMGAGHGLTARMQRRTIAKYTGQIEAANAAMTGRVPLRSRIAAKLKGLVPERIREAVRKARGRGKKLVTITTLSGKKLRVPVGELGMFEVSSGGTSRKPTSKVVRKKRVSRAKVRRRAKRRAERAKAMAGERTEARKKLREQLQQQKVRVAFARMEKALKEMSQARRRGVRAARKKYAAAKKAFNDALRDLHKRTSDSSVKETVDFLRKRMKEREQELSKPEPEQERISVMEKEIEVAERLLIAQLNYNRYKYRGRTGSAAGTKAGKELQSAEAAWADLPIVAAERAAAAAKAVPKGRPPATGEVVTKGITAEMVAQKERKMNEALNEAKEKGKAVSGVASFEDYLLDVARSAQAKPRSERTPLETAAIRYMKARSEYMSAKSAYEAAKRGNQQ